MLVAHESHFGEFASVQTTQTIGWILVVAGNVKSAGNNRARTGRKLQSFDSDVENDIFEIEQVTSVLFSFVMGPCKDAHKMRIERSVDSNFSRNKARQFSSFLRALKDAQEYAQDLQCSSWEFAISLADIGATDVQIHDLRWMIRKGWIHHNGEATLEPGCHPNGRSDERSAIQLGSSFIIGQGGIDALRDYADAGGNIGVDSHIPDVPTVITPSWDAERHELSFVGQIVKRFRWPASNQETILMAFEEEAWPSHIHDPLPPVNDVDPKRRLSDSIKCLNRNQRVDLVRFRGDGTGQGIFWDARPDC